MIANEQGEFNGQEEGGDLIMIFRFMKGFNTE